MALLTRHWQLKLLAATITGLLFLAAPARAECPPVIRSGDNWIYPDCRVQMINGDFVKAKTLYLGCVGERDKAREHLLECRVEVADVLDDLANAPPPPPPPALWPWWLGGAAAVVVPVGTCTFVDCGAAHTPWLISGGLIAVGGLVAWLLE